LFLFTPRGLLEACLLSLSLSVDIFVAFLAYGARGMRVPKRSVAVTAGLCTLIFLVFALVGAGTQALIPARLARTVSFCVLFLLGATRVFDAAVKAAIRRGKMNKKVRFQALGIHFLLEVYADPETADLDAGGELLMPEAALLALAMSLDGAAAGFGAGAGGGAVGIMTLCSAAFCLAALLAGLRLGKFVAGRSPVDIAPAGGVMLIALAFLRLL
jgi:putative sporulation protein YtaF